MVKKITNTEFDTELATGLCVVDFYADWCGPCKMLSPIIDTVSENFSEIKFYKVNVDESEELAKKYQVMSIPTVYIFKDGKPISKKLGFMPQNQLENWLNEYK